MEKKEKATADEQVIEYEKYNRIVGKYFLIHMQMAEDVNTYLAKNSKEIDTIGQATRFSNLFITEFKEVIKYINIEEKKVKALISEKKKAHDDLVVYTEYMCKNLIALGTAYEIADLLTTVKVANSQIAKMNQDKFETFAKTVLAKAKQYIKQLAEFSISQKQIDEYKAKADLYSYYIVECDLAAKSHAEMQIQKYRAFAHMMGYLEKLDVIMQGAIFTKRQLVEDYQKVRRLRHMPVHTLALKLHVTDADTGENISNCSYKIKRRKTGGTELASKVKKTTAKGNGQEKNLPVDNYTITLEKIGYQILTENFITETGKTTRLELKMKKI